GAAIARGLSGAGADVVLHARTVQASQAVSTEIAGSGQKVWSLARDLAGPNAGRDLVQEAERLTGGLDILVINASVQINAALGGAEPEDVDLQIEVNLKSTLERLQACLPRM
ncbi:MAG: SDR family oxidoreductase, partial [Boseongicola sp. SB0670_bin_30]|nr:SDR family oxidoreductase [Boseongicola sp. SB0670_bin_30]